MWENVEMVIQIILLFCSCIPFFFFEELIYPIIEKYLNGNTDHIVFFVVVVDICSRVSA